MQLTSSVVPHQPPRQQDFRTPFDIYEAHCPECGHPLGVTFRHIGGYASKQPMVCCANPDGGEAHLLVRISPALAFDWFDFLHGLATANEFWAATMEEALA